MEVYEETKIYIEITDEYADLHEELSVMLAGVKKDIFPLMVKLCDALGIVLENASEKDGIT